MPHNAWSKAPSVQKRSQNSSAGSAGPHRWGGWVNNTGQQPTRSQGPSQDVGWPSLSNSVHDTKHKPPNVNATGRSKTHSRSSKLVDRVTHGKLHTSSQRGARNSKKTRIRPSKLELSHNLDDDEQAGFVRFSATHTQEASPVRIQSAQPNVSRRKQASQPPAPTVRHSDDYAPSKVEVSLPSPREQLILRVVGVLFAASTLKPDESLCVIDVHMMCQLLTLHGTQHGDTAAASRATASVNSVGARSSHRRNRTDSPNIHAAESGTFKLLDELFPLRGDVSPGRLPEDQFSRLCRLVQWLNPSLRAEWIGDLLRPSLLCQATNVSSTSALYAASTPSASAPDFAKSQSPFSDLPFPDSMRSKCAALLHTLRTVVTIEARSSLNRSVLSHCICFVMTTLSVAKTCCRPPSCS